VDIEGVIGVTLDGVTVTSHNASDTLLVGSKGTSEFVLEDSTSITGAGTLLVGADSTLEVEQGTSAIDLATITNQGKLEATNGATIDIKGDVSNSTGHIEAHGSGSTVELEAITVTGGTITIDAGNTLEIENGATTLNGVNVQNSGNLQIDDANVTATLVLGAGSSIDGHVIIGASGELDIDGGTFLNPTTIDDSGILHATDTVFGSKERFEDSLILQGICRRDHTVTE